MSALANIEAEISILGAMLRDNTIIDSIADRITDEDFCEPAHARIFTTILRHAAQGKAANPMTLAPFFRDDEAMDELGGPAYLMDLTADLNGFAVKDTADMLAELTERRRMQKRLEAAANACEDHEQTIAEIVDFADAALLPQGHEKIHQPTGAECFDELIREFDEPRHGVTCGNINCLDELLGPMRPKQLIIVAGRPGMGKTTAALSYSLGAAQRGHGVLFVSLEMSSTELAGKMAADMCADEHRIPFTAIRDGNPNNWQRQRIIEARNRMAALPLNVVDTGMLTIGKLNMLIRRHARRMAAKGQKLELVVVDYLQLLSPDSKGRSNYEAVSEVSRGLKAMAKDHGVAIMALAQLSREVEKRPDKRPMLSDLRDSGQIEQDADAVMFLMRPEYYLQQIEPGMADLSRVDWETKMQENAGRIEFIVAKRRNGVTGSATGMFSGTYQAVRG